MRNVGNQVSNLIRIAQGDRQICRELAREQKTLNSLSVRIGGHSKKMKDVWMRWFRNVTHYRT